MSGPDSAVAALRVAVRAMIAQQQRGGLPEGALLFVACSGGADSLALAATAAFVAPRMGVRAGAVIVDHGMQAGSAEIAEQARRACLGLGLDPVVVTSPEDLPTGQRTHMGGAEPTEGATAAGPEGGARSLRYQLLAGAVDAYGAGAIMLGHTLDDQAETVLLALARGSGTRSLAGMAPIRGPWWRPLLGITRAQTRQAAQALNLPIWDDPTNEIDGPWQRKDGGPLPRAALRHRVLPALREALGPGATAALARTAELARQDADLLEDLAEALRANATIAVTDEEKNAGILAQADIDTLAGAPAALRTRVLLALARLADTGGQAGARHVSELERLVTDWHGQGAIHLPGALEATRECGRLVVRVASAHQARKRTDEVQEM